MEPFNPEKFLVNYDHSELFPFSNAPSSSISNILNLFPNSSYSEPILSATVSL